jgi:hypothetical protein
VALPIKAILVSSVRYNISLFINIPSEGHPYYDQNILH